MVGEIIPSTIDRLQGKWGKAGSLPNITAEFAESCGLKNLARLKRDWATFAGSGKPYSVQSKILKALRDDLSAERGVPRNLYGAPDKGFEDLVGNIFKGVHFSPISKESEQKAALDKVMLGAVASKIVVSLKSALGDRIADDLEPHKATLVEIVLNDPDSQSLLQGLENNDPRVCLDLVLACAKKAQVWEGNAKLSEIGLSKPLTELLRRIVQENYSVKLWTIGASNKSGVDQDTILRIVINKLTGVNGLQNVDDILRLDLNDIEKKATDKAFSNTIRKNLSGATKHTLQLEFLQLAVDKPDLMEDPDWRAEALKIFSWKKIPQPFYWRAEAEKVFNSALNIFHPLSPKNLIFETDEQGKLTFDTDGQAIFTVKNNNKHEVCYISSDTIKSLILERNSIDDKKFKSLSCLGLAALVNERALKGAEANVALALAADTSVYFMEFIDKMEAFDRSTPVLHSTEKRLKNLIYYFVQDAQDFISAPGVERGTEKWFIDAVGHLESISRALKETKIKTLQDAVDIHSKILPLYLAKHDPSYERPKEYFILESALKRIPSEAELQQAEERGANFQEVHKLALGLAHVLRELDWTSRLDLMDLKTAIDLDNVMNELETIIKRSDKLNLEVKEAFAQSKKEEIDKIPSGISLSDSDF